MGIWVHVTVKGPIVESITGNTIEGGAAAFTEYITVGVKAIYVGGAYSSTLWYGRYGRHRTEPQTLVVVPWRIILPFPLTPLPIEVRPHPAEYATTITKISIVLLGIHRKELAPQTQLRNTNRLLRPPTPMIADSAKIYQQKDNAPNNNKQIFFPKTIFRSLRVPRIVRIGQSLPRVR